MMFSRPLLLTFLLASAAIAAPEYNWEKFEGCTLVDSKWKDGDSFSVRIGPDQERIFRLYFVDTPEDRAD